MTKVIIQQSNQMWKGYVRGDVLPITQNILRLMAKATTPVAPTSNC